MSAIKSPRFVTSHIAHRTSHITFRGRGFTLVELLVVIAIIALLIGILLPALSAARDRAKKLAASAQLQSLSGACDSYYTTFNAYPGYFKDGEIAGYSGTPRFSGTESLALSLMGQVASASSSTTFSITVGGTTYNIEKDYDTTKTPPVNIGKKGPRTNAGRLYGAFFSPKSEDLYDTNGNFYDEIVDPWGGMPVLYFRSVASGTTPVTANGGNGIFYRDAAHDYLTSAIPSAKGGTYDNSSSKSLLANSNVDNMAWFVINTEISTSMPNSSSCVVKGAYVLWSAGGDGIYLSTSQSSSVSESSISKFDDVIVTGGTR